jgi:hypothetical protein
MRAQDVFRTKWEIEPQNYEFHNGNAARGPVTVLTSPIPNAALASIPNRKIGSCTITIGSMRRMRPQGMWVDLLSGKKVINVSEYVNLLSIDSLWRPDHAQ